MPVQLDNIKIQRKAFGMLTLKMTQKYMNPNSTSLVYTNTNVIPEQYWYLKQYYADFICTQIVQKV